MYIGDQAEHAHDAGSLASNDAILTGQGLSPAVMCGTAHSNLYGAPFILSNYATAGTAGKRGPDLRKVRNVRAV